MGVERKYKTPSCRDAVKRYADTIKEQPEKYINVYL